MYNCASFHYPLFDRFIFSSQVPVSCGFPALQLKELRFFVSAFLLFSVTLAMLSYHFLDHY